MKKSELKTGMLVKNALGSYGIVMLGTPQGDSIVGGGRRINPDIRSTWFPMFHIEDDIDTSYDEAYRIVEVWSYSSNSTACEISTADRTLLWKAKHPKHLIDIGKNCQVYLLEDGFLQCRLTGGESLVILVKEAIAFIEDLRTLDETGCLMTARLNPLGGKYDVKASFITDTLEIGCQTFDFDSLYTLLDLIK